MFTLDNFYKSKEFVGLREVLMNQRVNEKGQLICAHCGQPILKKYDCIAHHKIELTEQNVTDMNISLNPENIDLIHFRCHNMIHKRFGHENKKKVYIVYGPPCSGKRSYIETVAGENDLVVDLDSIYQMISISGRYTNTQRLRQNAFAVRDLLIEQIRTRFGKWQDAYIIGGYPLLMDRVRLADSLRADLIYIDTPVEECYIEATRRGVSQRWIDEWFDRYQEG